MTEFIVVQKTNVKPGKELEKNIVQKVDSAVMMNRLVAILPGVEIVRSGVTKVKIRDQLFLIQSPGGILTLRLPENIIEIVVSRYHIKPISLTNTSVCDWVQIPGLIQSNSTLTMKYIVEAYIFTKYL